MPKYLIRASYNPEGIQGLLKEGGAGRREAVEKLAASLGGTMESFYFAFGFDDVFTVVDLPDNASAAAASLIASAAGAVRTNVTVLLSPEEVDQATRKSPEYRAPGQ